MTNKETPKNPTHTKATIKNICAFPVTCNQYRVSQVTANKHTIFCLQGPWIITTSSMTSEISKLTWLTLYTAQLTTDCIFYGV